MLTSKDLYTSIRSLTMLFTVGFFACTNVKSDSLSNSVFDDIEQTPTLQTTNVNDVFGRLDDDPILTNIIDAVHFIRIARNLLTSDINLLQLMKSDADLANTDAISTSRRSMLNAEYQKKLSQINLNAYVTYFGIPLLSGGCESPTRLGTLNASTTGVGTTNIDPEFTVTGFVAGTVESVVVNSSDQNSAFVGITIGGQPFVGTIPMRSTGYVQLTSNVDPSNTITMCIAGTGLTSTSEILSELNSHFQLDICSPICIRSTSTDLSSTLTKLEAGAATVPGVYGLSYAYDEATGAVTYKISNGDVVWETSYSAMNAVTGELNENSRIVSFFDYGPTVVTAGNTDETKPISGIELYSINPGSQLDLSFQIGENASDLLDVHFPSATTKALGLSIIILTKEYAASAANAIDEALIEICMMIAKLGGVRSKFDCANDVQNLKLDYQNPSDPLNRFHLMKGLCEIDVKWLERMKNNSTQANSDSISSGQRAIIDELYQADLWCITRISNELSKIDSMLGLDLTTEALELNGTYITSIEAAGAAENAIDAALVKVLNKINEIIS